MVYFTLFRLGKENPKAFSASSSNIGKAIENYRSALQLRPAENDPDRPIALINLGVALVQKDGEDDLMNAINNLREAVELCTRKPTLRPLLLLSLDNLAQAYDSHYNHSEDISDVVGKVDVLRRIVDLTDEGNGRLVPLVNLMNALWRFWEIQHNRNNDLDEVVLRGREALELSDGSDKIIHAKALTTLSPTSSPLAMIKAARKTSQIWIKLFTTFAKPSIQTPKTVRIPCYAVALPPPYTSVARISRRRKERH